MSNLVASTGPSACVTMVPKSVLALTNDLTHLMRAIEVGDCRGHRGAVRQTAHFLTDRCPRYSYAIDHVNRAKGQFSPLLPLSVGHDGIGPPLPKNDQQRRWLATPRQAALKITPPLSAIRKGSHVARQWCHGCGDAPQLRSRGVPRFRRNDLARSQSIGGLGARKPRMWCHYRRMGPAPSHRDWWSAPRRDPVFLSKVHSRGVSCS